MKAKRDLVNALLILAVCIFAYYETYSISYPGARSTGPAFFPRIVIPLAGFLAFCLLLSSLRRIVKDRSISKLDINPFSWYRRNHKVVHIFGLFTAYVMAMQYIGYVVSTPIFLVATYLMLAESRRKPWIGIAGYLVLTALLYLVFRYLLSVFLPTGQLL